MIGVFCQEAERVIAREFFELFKTPWEFLSSTADYDVVVSTRFEIPEVHTRLMIFYSSKPVRIDMLEGIETGMAICKCIADHQGNRLPVYGSLASFHTKGLPLIRTEPDSEIVAVEFIESHRKIIRVGFDLFSEFFFLLTEGQSVENAFSPTLESHISILRGWIISAGIPLIEIPPIPFGYTFFASLTHDVDFCGIRRHKFDHTMWGFVYRGIVGSLIKFIKGRISFAKLIKNWIAVMKLPFIFIGLAADFWEHFDKYADIEDGLSSTFFLIPFKSQTGVDLNNKNSYKRATHYDIGDVGKQVKHLMNRGFEIGLHGIDAWNSSEMGSQEMKRIVEATCNKKIGVRMHWLFYNHQSPLVLEQAGFEYDATLGYNETIGFKNGTLQVFRPIGVGRLLEIPLNIQDTALFYPGRLNLSNADASQLCNKLMDAACCHGGVLTVSWHERSLEPERLWGDLYKWLLGELRTRGAWIGNAHQIVEWFRRRRLIAFKECILVGNKFEIGLICDEFSAEPKMFLRLHLPSRSAEHEDEIIDIPWNGEAYLEIPILEKESE